MTKQIGIPQIARATDSTGADDADEAVVKRKIANRRWIGQDGKEAENEEAATGASYEFLGRGDVPGDNGKVFAVQWGDLTPDAQKLYGLFGMNTLWGNVVNTWLGDKSSDKAATAHDAIRERHELLMGGKWIDRSGAVGARVDLGKLRDAIVEAGTSAGFQVDPAKIEARLGSDAEYVKAIRQRADVSAAYARLMGRATLDDSAAFG